MIDTDSFIFDFKCENVYEEMKKISEIFDFSNYDKNHFLYSDANKKKLGYLKDEAAGQLLKTFIGLKSKLYSIEYANGGQIKRCKGLQNIVLKKYINHQDYYDVLKKDQIIVSENRLIRGRNFQINTIKINKVSHQPMDDKRFILNDKITTLPYGYNPL